MLSRSRLREKVFVLLFESEFNDPGDMPEQARLYLKESDEACDEESAAYVEERFNRVRENIPAIDELIEKHSNGWSIDRIGRVELSVLRLAVFELKYDEDIPAGVAINEAVNLAKKYGQDGAGPFINGILANFA
ncbi:MAG: transcription antitermination factor NusB [Lachnospiraceae bacterium]|nr:transcription antitermination factor NusB [Lachnospiraceae bacterium]